jgi:nicotinamidase-related amidase
VSAFAGSNLDTVLRRRGIDTLFLAGFALQACIESTARHGKDLGYRVYIVDDATAAFSAEQRAYVLDQVMWMFARRTTAGALSSVLSRELTPA